MKISAIVLMSVGKTGERRGPHTSDPYDTVVRTQALNSRLIMGKDVSHMSLLNLDLNWDRAPTAF